MALRGKGGGRSYANFSLLDSEGDPHNSRNPLDKCRNARHVPSS